MNLENIKQLKKNAKLNESILGSIFDFNFHYKLCKSQG